MNADLLTALSGILGNSAPPAAPEPLPSIPLSFDMPAPQATPPAMPSPAPIAPAPKKSAVDVIRELMPMILSAAVGIKDPVKGAALAHGQAQGMLAAQRENQADEERAQAQRDQALHFQQQTAQAVMSLKDPIERQRYLQYADQIGAEHFGLPQGWTTKIPAHDSKDDALATLKSELAAKLKAFDADKKWATVAGTPQEGKISFKLSNGQSVPVNMARQLVGQAVFDETGNQAFAPESAVEGKTEQERAASLLAAIRAAKGRGDTKKADELQAAYNDLIQAKRDTDKPVTPQSIDAALLDAYQKGNTAEVDRLLALKRKAGDAGRAAPINITIPGLSGMSAADRVETAADDMIAGRLAPSQLATFFTGMGKESASQLRSLVMQRVKQKQPEFNFQQAEANYRFGSATGTQNTVRYLDSVKESIPLLLDRAEKLANGNIRGINALVNAGKNQINDVDLKKFQTDALFVADEVAKILQGGGTGSGTSDAKLKQAAQILQTTDSPAAIKGALEDISELLGFRRRTLTKGTFLDTEPSGNAPSKAKVRFNPATGKLEPIK